MNIKTAFSIIALLYSTIVAQAQAPELEWAVRFGGSSIDAGLSIATDISGNVYTTGYFGNTADFDPGAGICNFTSAGYNDIFVSMMDANGNFIWAKQFGGTNDDQGLSITIDDSANSYITGYFQGTVDFDSDPVGVYNLTSLGSSNIFITKLDANGNFVWAKQFGGTSSCAGLSLALDSAANVYTTGRFMGTADFDPDPVGIHNLTSAGGYDIFVSKIDANGNFIWAKQFGGINIGIGNSITVDDSGNVYTTGYFWGTSDFDPDLVGTQNLTSAGSGDVFVSKLDANGNFMWAKQFAGTDMGMGNSIVVDKSGNVFTTGSFWYDTDFDPDPVGIQNLTVVGQHSFISKLDAGGNFVWAGQLGGNSSDIGRSIALDDSGNVYTTGYFGNTADFDPGIGTYYLTSVGNHDIYISKLDTNGNFVWAKKMGGTLQDEGNSLVIDAARNIYTTGLFQGTADFDPDPVGEQNLTSAGSVDIFVHKIQQCTNTSSSITETICDSYSAPDGTVYTTSGIKTAVIPNAAGCDSTVTINLTIINSTTSSITETVCDNYAAPDGTVYTTSGIKTAVIPNAAGCDSTVTINLTIINSTTSSITETVCDNYAAPDGTVYTTSGIKTAVIPNAAGCDSTVTINLTIINSTTSSITETACDNYAAPDGTVYTTSGIKTAVIPNAAGCDSTVTINLIIINSTTSSITETACDNYAAPDGTVYTTSGIKTAVIPNAAGCDSTVTVNLTIKNSTTSSITETACDNYTAPDGTVYTTSGIKTAAIPNANGCDSTITIDLTINSVDVSVIQNANILTANTTPATYQWLDCNNSFNPIPNEIYQTYIATANGNYAVEITQNGCLDTSLCHSFTALSIIENTFTKNILVYPNPTNGLVFIDLGANLHEIIVTISDVHGSVVKKLRYKDGQLLYVKIDEPNGNYFLTILSENKTAIVRLIKN